MRAEKIRDEEGLRRWLAGRPEETRQRDAVMIAQRCACRVLPIFAAWSDAEAGYPVGIRPTWRANLASGVSILKEISFPGIDAAADAYYPTAVYYAADAGNETYYAARSADYVAAALRAVSAANRAERSADHRSHADAWYEAVEDAVKVEKGQSPLSAPLWSRPPPGWFSEADAYMRNQLTAAPSACFDFWLRWWDGVLTGNPLNWDFQREVALIPEEVWQAGPGAVAERIAIIEEKYRLKDEVAALRRQLEAMQESLAQAASAAQRSHNNPPELIEPEAALRRDVGLIVTALRDAETELSKSEPEPSLLDRLGNTVLQATKSILLYCGSLADRALKKIAEEVGSTGAKWVIGVYGATQVFQIEPLQSAARALIELAKKYAGM